MATEELSLNILKISLNINAAINFEFFRSLLLPIIYSSIRPHKKKYLPIGDQIAIKKAKGAARKSLVQMKTKVGKSRNERLVQDLK